MITIHSHGTHGAFLAAIAAPILRERLPTDPTDHSAIRAAFAATDSILRDRLLEQIGTDTAIIGPLGVVRYSDDEPATGGLHVSVLWPDSGVLAHVGGPGHDFDNPAERARFLETDRTLTSNDFVRTADSTQTLFVPPYEAAPTVIGFSRALGDFHLRRYGLIAIPTIVA
jgi:hypothetical protein